MRRWILRSWRGTMNSARSCSHWRSFSPTFGNSRFLAHHDPLTGLPNRALFQDRVQQALKLLDRSVGFAVLCLDLDQFKLVNDTLGHPVGDVLLQRVAERLRACVRDGDTVARLGGDEFAIILLNLNEPSELDVLASRIIETVRSSYEIDGHLIHIGTSIGMALAPADGAISDELLKKADTALYEAKSGGGGVSCFYEDAMNVALQSRRQIEAGLRRALVEDEFVLYYQPLVDAQSHRVCSCEALIRWNHPERGLIFPDLLSYINMIQFICRVPVAIYVASPTAPAANFARSSSKFGNRWP